MAQEDARPRLKRHLEEEAINLAMQSRWSDALAANQKILEMFPNDVDAHNRAGRALTELGRYAEAQGEYQKSVEIDPNNIIAQKNLRRLSRVSQVQVEEPARPAERVDLRLLSTETGKTGTLPLVQVPDHVSLSKMSVGDKVRLEIDGRALLVYNSSNQLLGQVEPRLSQRLIDMMKGGNRYTAAMLDLEESHPQVIIQEVYQDPSQLGKVSFPPKSTGPAVRSYVRDSLFRYGIDEEEEEEEGEEGPEAVHEAEEPIEEDYSDESSPI